MDDPHNCILARGRVCVGTIWEKGDEIKTATEVSSLKTMGLGARAIV